MDTDYTIPCRWCDRANPADHVPGERKCCPDCDHRRLAPCGGCRGLGGHRITSPSCEFYQDPLTCGHPSWTGEDGPKSHDGYALWWRCDACGLMDGPR